MMLMYYEEQTPKEYEPPGFMPAVFELSNLFHGETVVKNYGNAVSPHHTVGLYMERLDAAAQEAPKEVNNTQEMAESSIENSSVAATCNTEQEILSCQGEIKENAAEVISCLCGCNLNDLDMIQCDCCSSWQHTVCAGFYSNRDHRIQDVNYVCFSCRYTNNKSVLKQLKDLSAYRRALSVVFNEGIRDEKQMAPRLGFTARSTKRQIQRMIDDKFVCKPSGKHTQFTVIKTKDVRDRLRQYFNYELIKFPSFNSPGESLTQPRVTKPSTPPKMTNDATQEIIRTSVTELTLSVNDILE
jgi:hypothetical protein